MNSGSLGRYDECLSIEVPDDANSSLVAFRGSFCSVFVKMRGNPFIRKLMRRLFESTPQLKMRLESFEEFESLHENPYQEGLRAALCAPSTCSAADMETLLTSATEPYGIHVKVPVCKDSSPTAMGTEQVTALCALIFLLAVVILASAVDLWFRHSSKTRKTAAKDRTAKAQLLLAFSGVTNTQRLFDLNAGSGGRLRCLEGVRFLSAVWVVVGHNYVVAEPNSMGNVLDIFALKSNIALTSVFSGYLSIETFFMLSGFLVAYAIFNEVHQKKEPIPWPVKILRRHVRMTGPAFLFVLLALLYPALLSGPIADHIKEDNFVKPCRSSWWTPLVHVLNIQPIKKMCGGHMWYLSCNFQIYIACFGFIVLMKSRISVLLFSVSISRSYTPEKKKKRKPLIGGLCLVVLSAAATVAVAVQVYSYRYGAFIMMGSLHMESTADHIRYVYMLPHQHFVSFAMGVFEAYAIVNKKLGSTARVRVAVLWVVALAITTLVCLFPYAWDSASIPYDPVLAAVYASLYPVLWSVSLSWMLHSCITGTAGLVNRFLSMGVFIPLGKLSFSLYLVHPYVLFTKVVTIRQFRALDQWTMLTDAIWLLFLSLFFAFIFYIVCECPITNLDKVAVDAILKRRRRDATNDAPPANVRPNNVELGGCGAQGFTKSLSP
ncbi:hypothetical protein MTO96_028588 [Rhipicephalus appendiculatus]